MPTFEQFAVEHPQLRRAVLAAATIALLAVAVLTKEGEWRMRDVATFALTVAAGAAVAAAAARADALMFASSPQRTRRWGRRAAWIGALGGVAAAFVLARGGHIAVSSLVIAFLAGFVSAATLVYPIRSRRDDDNRDIANSS